MLGNPEAFSGFTKINFGEFAIIALIISSVLRFILSSKVCGSV